MKFFFNIYLVLFLSLDSLQVFSQCKIDYSNYQLVLDEQFDSYGGLTSNLFGASSIWKDVPDDPNSTWGKNEYYPGGQSILVSDGNGGYRLRLNATQLAVPHTLPSGQVVKYKSGIITLKNENDLTGFTFFDARTNTCSQQHANQRGFRYGIFEFRAKTGTGSVTKYDVWPALWILSVCAEYDLIDNSGPDESRQILSGLLDWAKQPWDANNPNWVSVPFCSNCSEFDMGAYYFVNDIISTSWGASFKCTHNTEPIACAAEMVSEFRNLQSEFTTYSLAWLPNKVTFFVEGREMFTIPYDPAKNNINPACPMNILATLQMHAGATGYQYTMDVDYIKVYKPIDNNLTLPFKSENEFVQHDIFKGATQSPVAVHSDFGSIALNPNNNNEVFYRGVDNYLYVAKHYNTGWTFTRLEYNSGITNLAKGMIKYLPNHDILIYVGADNRINMFGRSNVEPCGFYHWFLTDNWNCYWCNGTDYIKSNGTIEVSNNEEVFYTGFDNKVHRYYSNGTNWVHEILYGNNYQASDYVWTNMCLDNANNTNTVFYQGNDFRIHVLYKNNVGQYIHGNISAANELVNSKNGSLQWAPSLNSLLYIGTDNEIHKYTYNGGWQHYLLNYSYNSPNLGYPGADFAKSGLRWEPVNNRLLYLGWDGRIQAFADIVQNGSAANHLWIDDNWNNGNFCSFTSADNANFSSSTITRPDETIFYTMRNNHLGYFKYENCEYILPYCDHFVNPIRNIFKVHNNTNDKKVLEIKMYPNPVVDNVVIEINGEVKDAIMNVYSTQGKKIYAHQLPSNFTEINFSLLPAGIYIAEIINGNIIERIKFCKQ